MSLLKTFNKFIILGGHRLSTTYIKHLLQAKSEGLIAFDSLAFIDPATNPFALSEIKSDIQHIKKIYTEGLAGFFATANPDELKNMWLVPDHTAPHVLFQLFIGWLSVMDLSVEVLAFTKDLKLPFQKTLESGICAISYATWTCPLECEEPKICPAINNDRSWDFGNSLKLEQFEGVDSIHLFGCEQIAYGVCGIPLSLIKSEFDRLMEKHDKNPVFLVGTHSKCHGILGVAQIRESNQAA